MNKNLKEALFNVFAFILIFLFVLFVSTQALARKMNTLQTIGSPIFFYVDKKNVSVSSEVSGKIKEILVSSGQHVKRGELAVLIDATKIRERIATLEEFAEENVSARTEISILNNLLDNYKIYVPQDGVIDEVPKVKDSSVNTGDTLFSMFANSGTRLITRVTPNQYRELQKYHTVNVYSDRLGQVFSIEFESVRRVVKETIFSKNGNPIDVQKYELVFHFRNAEDGNAFFDNEFLEITSNSTGDNDDNSIKYPMEYLRDMWNALIIGK